MKKLLLFLSLVTLASCKKEAAAPQQPVVETKPVTTTAPVTATAIAPATVTIPQPAVKSHQPQIVSKHETPPPPRNTKDSLYLARLLLRFEDAPQTFVVPATGISTITGKGGTIITINPANLATTSGTNIEGSITVELKELLDTTSLLKNNAQTMSGDRVLVSGGSYYIGIKNHGDDLKLKPGKTLEVRFPKITNDGMELFYGNNSSGQMDWQKAGVDFENPVTDEFAVDIQLTNTALANANANTISFRSRDTLGIKTNANLTKVEKAVTKELYETIKLNKLGWINCDRFYNQAVTNVQYALTSGDIPCAATFLVFNDIRSVVSGYYDSHTCTIFNMPINRKATFIMIAVKDEKVYAHSEEVTIKPGMLIKPELKEIPESGVAQLFAGR